MGGVFFFCVPFHIRLEKFRAGSWFFHLSRAIWGPPRAPGTKCGYDMGVRYGKCVFHRLSCSSAFETLQIKFYGLLRSEISIRAINFVARVPSYCNFECKAFSFRPDQPWVGALFENLNDAYRFYIFANQKNDFFFSGISSSKLGLCISQTERKRYKSRKKVAPELHRHPAGARLNSGPVLHWLRAGITLAPGHWFRAGITNARGRYHKCLRPVARMPEAGCVCA